MVAELADPARHVRVGGGQQAAVAERAEVLGRVEGERRRVAERARRTSVRRVRCAASGVRARPARCGVAGTDRLRGVLDHDQPAGVREAPERRRRSELAVEVYRQERPGARCDGRCGGVRVDQEGPGRQVDEHRRRPHSQDRLGGGEEGERRGDHLVARPHVQGAEREEQRVRPGVEADRVRDAQVRGRFGLERRDLGSEHELTGVEDARPGRVELGADIGDLGGEVDQGHGIGGGHAPC